MRVLKMHTYFIALYKIKFQGKNSSYLILFSFSKMKNWVLRYATLQRWCQEIFEKNFIEICRQIRLVKGSSVHRSWLHARDIECCLEGKCNRHVPFLHQIFSYKKILFICRIFIPVFWFKKNKQYFYMQMFQCTIFLRIVYIIVCYNSGVYSAERKHTEYTRVITRSPFHNT